MRPTSLGGELLEGGNSVGVGREQQEMERPELVQIAFRHVGHVSGAQPRRNVVFST